MTFPEKILFTKNLGVMIKAGIPLLEALETISQQGGNGGYRRVISSLVREVKNGQSLAMAMGNNKKIFDSFYVSLIRIGEESGELEKNLIYLGEKLDKDMELRRKVSGVMLYPVIVLVATGVVGIVMSFFILPQLATLFSSLEVKLPLSTKVLMFVAEMVKRYNVLLLAGFLGIVAGFRVLVELPAVKPRWHKYLISMPLVGRFLVDVEVTNFCRSLGVMLNSGMSIVAALKILEENTDNLVFRGYVGRMVRAVEKGKTLDRELVSMKESKFPSIAVKMIGTGERSGNLPGMLLYLGDYFEGEIEVMTKNFSTTLEPVMLIIVGLVVTFMAMAIISPIYDLTGSIGGR